MQFTPDMDLQEFLTEHVMSSYVTGGLANFLKPSSSDPATGHPFRVLDKKQVKLICTFYILHFSI
jgi:hypothetical protein